jgi:hypothetical protein
MLNVQHLSMTELEAGMDHIRQSPKDNGILRMIVRRPQEDERELVESGELDPLYGLLGDNWKDRESGHTQDESANTNTQITIMNARTIALLAQDEERWSLAGDQLYIDMDLSADNLPPGTRLAVGSAVIEVSAQPHTVWRGGNEICQFARRQTTPLARHQRKSNSGWCHSSGRCGKETSS